MKTLLILLLLSSIVPGQDFADSFNTGSLDTRVWTIDTGSAPGANINHVGIFEAGNVDLSQGMLALRLIQTQSGSVVHSSGAEVRSIGRYGYGRYTWRMRTASTASTWNGAGVPVSGSISSGFTFYSPGYTEVDCPEVEGVRPNTIEFTNWDTNKMNQTSSSTLINPDQGYHDYMCDWSQGKVVYYVDGVLVSTHITHVPSAPAYVLLQLWGTNGSNFGGLATVDTTRWVYFSKFTYSSETSMPAAPTGLTGIVD